MFFTATADRTSLTWKLPASTNTWRQLAGSFTRGKTSQGDTDIWSQCLQRHYVLVLMSAVGVGMLWLLSATGSSNHPLNSRTNANELDSLHNTNASTLLAGILSFHELPVKPRQATRKRQEGGKNNTHRCWTATLFIRSSNKNYFLDYQRSKCLFSPINSPKSNWGGRQTIFVSFVPSVTQMIQLSKFIFVSALQILSIFSLLFVSLS